MYFVDFRYLIQVLVFILMVGWNYTCYHTEFDLFIYYHHIEPGIPQRPRETSESSTLEDSTLNLLEFNRSIESYVENDDFAIVNHSLQGIDADGYRFNYAGGVSPPTSTPHVSMDIDALYVISDNLPFNYNERRSISLFIRPDYKHTIRHSRMVHVRLDQNPLTSPTWISHIVNVIFASSDIFKVR